MSRGKPALPVMDGRPVVPWIYDRLSWARAHGWSGKVRSGFRSHAEQHRLYDEWQRGERPGPVARPGTSNHEGRRYPRGAVDVTEWFELVAVLARRPGFGHPLVWFGPGDPPHFSATGR